MPRLVLKNVGGPGAVACFFGGEVSDRNMIFFFYKQFREKAAIRREKAAISREKPRLVYGIIYTSKS